MGLKKIPFLSLRDKRKAGRAFRLCRFCAVISGKCGKRGICGRAESISYMLSIWTVGPNPSLSAITLVIWHLQAGDTYTDS